PRSLDRWMNRAPWAFGPLVSVPIVMTTFTLGLFCLMILTAPRIRSWTVLFSNSSVFSMSRSIAVNLPALITFWYAAARFVAFEQVGPSLLRDQPPIDGMASPPAARIWLTRVMSAPVSDRLPSHAGLQLPLDRTNARVNDLMPVCCITVTGFWGFSHWYR